MKNVILNQVKTWTLQKIKKYWKRFIRMFTLKKKLKTQNRSKNISYAYVDILADFYPGVKKVEIQPPKTGPAKSAVLEGTHFLQRFSSQKQGDCCIVQISPSQPEVLRFSKRLLCLLVPRISADLVSFPMSLMLKLAKFFLFLLLWFLLLFYPSRHKFWRKIPSVLISMILVANLILYLPAFWKV